MFGLGMGELVVILLIVVLMFGGKKLPQLGSSLGESIKNFKKGMGFLVKSLSADKTNDKAWTNMGFALLQAGAKDKALSCFQSALQFNPQNQKAIQAIKGIQSGN